MIVPFKKLSRGSMFSLILDDTTYVGVKTGAFTADIIRGKTRLPATMHPYDKVVLIPTTTYMDY